MAQLPETSDEQRPQRGVTGDSARSKVKGSKLGASKAEGSGTAFSERATGALMFALVFVAVVAVYVRTLLPGIHPWGDVTKAQFFGRLLGTTHPTGYPAYALITHAFSALPIGSLAFRGNLFSALCGAFASGVLSLTLRSLGARWEACVAAGVAFGWTRIQWSQSVIAEVYGLNIAFVALTAFLFVQWRRRRQDGWLIAACTSYAFSFGNHLTVVTFLPAVLWVTLRTDWRCLLRWRTAGSIALIVFLAALLYLYPLWRTRSNAIYLEYQVHSLADLINYVSGDHYRGSMFAFSGTQIVSERLPLLTKTLLQEVGASCLLFPIGIWSLNDRTLRGFFGLALAGPFVWALNYDMPDIELYLIPSIYFLVLVVGLGGSFVLETMSERFLGLQAAARPQAPSWRRVLVLTFAILVSALLPASLLVDNFAASDQSQNTRFARKSQKLMEKLGGDAVLFWQGDYGRRMALIYFLYGEGAAERRKIYWAAKPSARFALRYLKGKGRPLEDKHLHQTIPRRLRLVTNHARLIDELRPAGVESHSVGQGLFELTLRSSP